VGKKIQIIYKIKLILIKSKTNNCFIQIKLRKLPCLPKIELFLNCQLVISWTETNTSIYIWHCISLYNTSKPDSIHIGLWIHSKNVVYYDVIKWRCI